MPVLISRKTFWAAILVLSLIGVVPLLSRVYKEYQFLQIRPGMEIKEVMRHLGPADEVFSEPAEVHRLTTSIARCCPVQATQLCIYYCAPAPPFVICLDSDLKVLGLSRPLWHKISSAK